MLKQQQQKKKKINSYVILPMGRLLYLDINLKKKKRKKEKLFYARMFQVEMLKKRDSK